MTLNEHVNVDTTLSESYDKFTPDEGYALWRDDMQSNIDEDGNPKHYYKQMLIGKTRSESVAPHIWARLIEEGMQVYGVTKPTEKV